jgi:glutaredoxin 3
LVKYKIKHELILLDTLTTGDQMKEQLGQLSGWQKSEPFIFIEGDHLGGLDELKAASQSGMLAKILNKANIDHEPFTNPMDESSVTK